MLRSQHRRGQVPGSRSCGWGRADGDLSPPGERCREAGLGRPTSPPNVTWVSHWVGRLVFYRDPSLAIGIVVLYRTLIAIVQAHTYPGGPADQRRARRAVRRRRPVSTPSNPSSSSIHPPETSAAGAPVLGIPTGIGVWSAECVGTGAD